jgi:hypothetical protein
MEALHKDKTSRMQPLLQAMQLSKDQFSRLKQHVSDIGGDRSALIRLSRKLDELCSEAKAHVESLNAHVDSIKPILSSTQLAEFLDWVEFNDWSLNILMSSSPSSASSTTVATALTSSSSSSSSSARPASVAASVAVSTSQFPSLAFPFPTLMPYKPAL